MTVLWLPAACVALLAIAIFAVADSIPYGAPRPRLSDRLRRFEPEYWTNLGRQERRAATLRPLLVSRSVLRPLLEEVGSFVQAWSARIGLHQPNLVETLAYARPGVSVTQHFGEKLTLLMIGSGFIPLTQLLGLRLLVNAPVWMWAALGMACFAAPDWWLSHKRTERRTRVLMELPTILSLLAIALAAGKSIEEAVGRVAQGSEGIVATELTRVRRELAMGKHYLVPALEEMAGRNGIPELDAVVGHIHAAQDLGLSLVETLRTEAAALRDRKRLRIVEEGGKGTVRMVLPVAVFILPVLFVILLAPAALEIAAWGS